MLIRVYTRIWPPPTLRPENKGVSDPGKSWWVDWADWRWLPGSYMENIPKIFRLRRALKQAFYLFILFLALLARRRRKILRFYTSRTRFPFIKSMISVSNPQNFRLRRNHPYKNPPNKFLYLIGGGFLTGTPLMPAANSGGVSAGYSIWAKKQCFLYVFWLFF